MARILIADPDLAFRKALILLLSHKMGIRDVSEAGDIGTLFQIMMDNPPDLLLLGWSLYGTPGTVTSQLLHKSHPHLKIVLFSVNPDDAAEAHAVGAAFLRKGAPPEEILTLLSSLVPFSTPQPPQGP